MFSEFLFEGENSADFWFTIKQNILKSQIICLEAIQNCSRIEHRSVIKFLVTEKSKLCEIFRKKIDMSMEKNFLSFLFFFFK